MNKPIFTESIIDNKEYEKSIPNNYPKDKTNVFLDRYFPKKWLKNYFNNKHLIYEGKQKK